MLRTRKLSVERSHRSRSMLAEPARATTVSSVTVTVLMLVVMTCVFGCASGVPSPTAESDPSAAGPAGSEATPPCDAPERRDQYKVVADVDAWEVYDDAENGFRIRYPPGWVVDDEAFDVVTADVARIESVVFSSPDALSDFTWRINVHPNHHDWSLAREFPSLAGDRHARSEPVVVDGVDGVLHIAYTCLGDRLRSDTVIVRRGEKTFEIMGGAERSFESFYESLAFTR